MSDDSPNQNDSPVSTPPAFGTNFNVSADPLSEIHRQVAEHEARDSHGRFVSSHQNPNPVISNPVQPVPPPPNTPNYPNLPNTPTPAYQGQAPLNPSIPSTPSNPPEPQVIHNTNTSTGNGGGNSNNSDDDPLFEAKINNPFSKFFNWLKKLIKNEGINIKIKPLTAIAMVIALTGGGGLIGGVVGYAFPHSSPILHREVALSGFYTKNFWWNLLNPTKLRQIYFKT